MNPELLRAQMLATRATLVGAVAQIDAQLAGLDETRVDRVLELEELPPCPACRGAKGAPAAAGTDEEGRPEFVCPCGTQFRLERAPA